MAFANDVAPLRQSFGELIHHKTFSQGAACLAALGDNAVAVGSSEGVQVISLDGTPSVLVPDFVVECLTPLGSQTLAGGNKSGYVCIWHWRRRTLKKVLHVSINPNEVAVNCLANGGDILLIGADDGAVRQLNVLEAWAQSDFFNAGIAVHAVAFSGTRAVLVGCVDGQILEVSRFSRRIIRKMDLCAPVQSLDADPDDKAGGRVVAVSKDVAAVWTRRKAVRGSFGDHEVEVEAPAAQWPVNKATGALLILGSRRVEDVIVASNVGLQRGASSLTAGGWQEAATEGNWGVATGLVRGSADTTFYVLFKENPGSAINAAGAHTEKIALFELSVPQPQVSRMLDDEVEDEAAIRTRSFRHGNESPDMVPAATVAAINSDVATATINATLAVAKGETVVSGETRVSSPVHLQRPASRGSLANAGRLITEIPTGRRASTASRGDGNEKASKQGSQYWDHTKTSRARAASTLNAKGLADTLQPLPNSSVVT